MTRTVPVLVCLPLLLGCGVHLNTTVARTLPFHVHSDDVAGYPELENTPAPAVPSSFVAKIGPFVPYYPEPAFVEYETMGENGTRWTVPEPPSFPEIELPRLLRGPAGDPPPNTPTLCGVVTAFQWYTVQGENATGGRIASRLTVVGADGSVLYEAERKTEGRASSATFLYRAHAHDWLQDARLLAALADARGTR